jgi:hypothetical protein
MYLYPLAAELATHLRSLDPIIPHQDVAVYAWDLASLITQASYCLTFLVSAGFPPHVVEPFQACVEDIMAFSDVPQGQEIPNLEHVSEHLSAVTFEVAVLAYAVLARGRARLGRKLCLEAVLTEEGQMRVRAMHRPRLIVMDEPTLAIPPATSLQASVEPNGVACQTGTAAVGSAQNQPQSSVSRAENGVPLDELALADMEDAVRAIGEAGIDVDAPTKLGLGEALISQRRGT